jgi:hypothetical protein
VRLVHDFISWVAGHCPDWPTIYASYSDELGTTANLRIQRTIELPSYQTIFRGRTRMARAQHALEGQRNTTVLEFVKHKGSFRAIAGQITGHGLNLGVIDDPIKGRAEAAKAHGLILRQHIFFGFDPVQYRDRSDLPNQGFAHPAIHWILK